MRRTRLTREEQKQDTRRRIIDAGINVFARMGFHGASIDKIVEEAGYTKGAFYVHFPSKESLFLTLFEEKLQSDVGDLHMALPKPYSIEQFIAHLTEQFESTDEEQRTWDILRMEFVLFAMRDTTIRDALASILKNAVYGLQQTLNEIYSEPDTPLPLEKLAWTVVSLESGMAIFQYIAKDLLPKHLFESSLRHLFQSTETGPV